MNLYQAAGVIMGANIGTTITSQLIAFNLSELAPVIIMAGIFMLMFSRKTRVQRAGEVLVGFGILFMGLTSMSSAMSVLKESPQVVNAMGSLNSHFLALVTGMAVTASTAELFCNCGNYPAACQPGTSGYADLLLYYPGLQHWSLRVCLDRGT